MLKQRQEEVGRWLRRRPYWAWEGMGLEPIRWEGRGLGSDLYLVGAAALACAALTLSESVESFIPCEGVWGWGYVGVPASVFLGHAVGSGLMRMWVDVPLHRGVRYVGCGA